MGPRRNALHRPCVCTSEPYSAFFALKSSDERYADLRVDTDAGILSVSIRHDDPTLVMQAFALACLATAPDVTGTLIYIRPYTEIQEHDWPIAWVFRGSAGVFAVPHVFQPVDSPQSGWTPNGTPIADLSAAFARSTR